MRVLICDDNVDSANTWAALLAVEGHEVRTSYSDKGCVEEAMVWQPQAALVDIGMPGMDGYVVATRIRGAPSRGTILLIAVTGFDAPEDRARSAAAGFSHHFRKPADIDALLHLLRTAGKTS
jgi:CheY-like chemotaxis protein